MSRTKPGRDKSRTRARKPQRGLLLAAAAGFLGLAGIFAVVALRSGRPAGTPHLRIEPSAYDLGQVSQAKGLVTVELGITNAGDGDLEIREMETTCGCTRAALVVDGKAGPWFGMRGHGEWPAGWSIRLLAGRQATLRVQYDPDAHGIYRGPIDRTVFIYSNDPARPRSAVRLTGTQIP